MGNMWIVCGSRRKIGEDEIQVLGYANSLFTPCLIGNHFFVIGVGFFESSRISLGNYCGIVTMDLSIWLHKESYRIAGMYTWTLHMKFQMFSTTFLRLKRLTFVPNI